MRLLLCLIVVLFMLPTDETVAGVLYARRPGTEAPLYALNISRIRTQVQIQGQLAVTHVDEEFFNDNNMTLEGFYAFTLPEGASVDGLWLWVDGNRLKFIVKRVEEARRLYDSVVVGERRDPAILESLGHNRFQLKVFPINPNSSRRIELRYFHTLPMTQDGFVHYRYPLNTATYQSDPVEETQLHIDVASHLPILEFHTNFEDYPLLNRVERRSDREYSIDFGTEHQVYTEDYEVRFKPADSFSLFPALSYRDAGFPGVDPYFICWHPLHDEEVEREGRDLVFVLDGSGSMNGGRISAVREAMTRLLPALGEDDRFRLVLFGTYAVASPAEGQFYGTTQEDVDAAMLFIDRYYTGMGGTNYGAAFLEAFRSEFRPDREARMLFLTDGQPTAGPKDLEGLRMLIEDNDTHGVRLFPVIFYSAAIELLDELAALRGGTTTNVEQGDDLATVISRLLLDLEVSGISSPEVEWLDSSTYFVYPRSFPEFLQLDKLVTTGRHAASSGSARVTAMSASQGAVEVTRAVDFAFWECGLPQVASYWASKHIEELLRQIQIHGPTEELKESVIALSIQHQVLTPYTAFLVLETNQIDPPVLPVDNIEQTPVSFTLQQNYPNPFSRSLHANTSIRFRLEQSAGIRIVVTDVLGRVVRVLEHGNFPAGMHITTWDGRDAEGRSLPAGCYLLTMHVAGGSVQTVRALLTD